jgi:DNA-binding response OmpR family regulator
VLKHIVIIESDKNILEIMQYGLEKVGYVVTGFNAFPSIQELVFMRADCFIIDEWFPNVSGHAICLMLKAKVVTNPIPVILTSSANLSEPVANFCGADVIIGKLCNIDYLVHTISSVLANRRVSLSKYGQL